MLTRLTLWTALCACVFSALIPAQAGTTDTPARLVSANPPQAGPAASVTAVYPVQTVSPGGTATLLVRVLDASSLPVPSQLVTFSTTAVGAYFLTSTTQYTNENGYAQAQLVVPAITGLYLAYASVAGLTPASFTLYVTGVGVGPYGSITALNPTQTIAPGGTATLSVRVLNASGFPAASQLVTFSTTAAGAVFVSSTTQYTDANGYAQAQLTVPTTTGVYLAYASVTGLGSATFTLYVGTGVTPVPATGMQIFSGNGQIVSIMVPTTPRPLTVVIRDANGVPVPGVYVTWIVTSGTATLLQSMSVTDSYGQTGVYAMGTTVSLFGYPYQQATIMASSSYGTVTFVLTSLGQNPDGSPIGVRWQLVKPAEDVPLVGKSGQTLPDAIRVLVYTSTNVPLPNVGLDVLGNLDPNVGPVAYCASPSNLTDGSGTAWCDLVFGKKMGDGTLSVYVGGVPVRTLAFSVKAGDPASATVIQGDGQSGKPGETLSQALVAEFRDAGGSAIPGLAVLWEFGAEGTGARLTNASPYTDASGRASATITLGPRAGSVVVRVKAASNTAIVATFTVKAVVAVTGLVKISGDNQTATTGQAFSAPLVVEVRDAQALPLANVTVSFSVTSGSATLSSATAVTGSDGRASVSVTAGATAGSITVSATADSQSVAFSLSSRLPGPVLTASSFVNGASFRPGLVPGAITTIVGAGLATGIKGCVGPGTVIGPLPTKVADVEVLFGSALAPIFAVCNVSGQEQVIVQAPFDLAPGFATMVKVSVSGGATVVDSVPVLTALPGIFETTGADGVRSAVVVGSDGRLISPSQRAKKGEVVYVYATGLGTVVPLSATNLPGFPGQKAWFPVIAGIAGKGVRVVSAEYAVNLLGVYVVAIEIPADAPFGADVALVLGVETVPGQTPAYSADSKIAIQ